MAGKASSQIDDHGDAGDDALMTASSLHEQAKFLLEDQIKYAESLRDSRKTTSALLAVIVGIGVFRIELFTRADNVLVVPSASLLALRIVFTLAVLFFLVGAYFLFTERSVLRELGLGQGLRGWALAVLHFNDEMFRHFETVSPTLVMQIRTRSLRLAYLRLREANRRVRRRLFYGWGLLFLGLMLVFSGFLIHFWTVAATNRIVP